MHIVDLFRWSVSVINHHDKAPVDTGMGDWLWSPWGTPDSSAKFTQRGSRDEVGSSVSCVIEPTECSFEALTKGTFCTSRGKQCLHIKECPGKGGVFIFCPGFQDVLAHFFPHQTWIVRRVHMATSSQVHVHDRSLSVQHGDVPLWRPFAHSQGTVLPVQSWQTSQVKQILWLYYI